MTRRGFLKTTAASASLLSCGVWSAASESKGRTDDEILTECQTRIGKHRQSDVVLVLRDGAGKPFPRATVKVEQTRHDFLFGCNFFQFGRTGDPAIEEAYRARFTAMFNFCTLGFYWANCESERGKPNRFELTVT